MHPSSQPNKPMNHSHTPPITHAPPTQASRTCLADVLPELQICACNPPAKLSCVRSPSWHPGACKGKSAEHAHAAGETEKAIASISRELTNIGNQNMVVQRIEAPFQRQRQELVKRPTPHHRGNKCINFKESESVSSRLAATPRPHLRFCHLPPLLFRLRLLLETSHRVCTSPSRKVEVGRCSCMDDMREDKNIGDQMSQVTSQLTSQKFVTVRILEATVKQSIQRNHQRAARERISALFAQEK